MCKTNNNELQTTLVQKKWEAKISHYEYYIDGTYTQVSSCSRCHNGTHSEHDFCTGENYTRQRGQKVTLNCANCQGYGHADNECPLCKKCLSPHHETNDCNQAYCTDCELHGHDIVNCPYKNRCKYCGKDGHTLQQCRYNFCFICKDFGHTVQKCPLNYCQRCKQLGHSEKTCKAKMNQFGGFNSLYCNNCHKNGHNTITCRKQKCYNCSNYGHGSHYCPKIRCSICQELGHQKETCFANKCSKCGNRGHQSSICDL
jgi:hypothetical protein